MAQRLNVEKCGVVDLYDLSLTSGGGGEYKKQKEKKEKKKKKKGGGGKEEVGGGRWRTTHEKIKGTPFLMG